VRDTTAHDHDPRDGRKLHLLFLRGHHGGGHGAGGPLSPLYLFLKMSGFRSRICAQGGSMVRCRSLTAWGPQPSNDSAAKLRRTVTRAPGRGRVTGRVHRAQLAAQRGPSPRAEGIEARLLRLCAVSDENPGLEKRVGARSRSAGALAHRSFSPGGACAGRHMSCTEDPFLSRAVFI